MTVERKQTTNDHSKDSRASDFVHLDYKTCKYGRISWINPTTKQECLGDRIPLMMLDDYINRHTALIKSYHLKILMED